MLETFITELSKELGLENELKAVPGQVVNLPLENDLSIQITPKTGAFLLSSNLAQIPLGNKEGLYTLLLHANLFGQGTQGACLGVSPDGNTLFVSKEVNDTGDYKAFHDQLEDFINVVDFWREEIRQHS